LIYDAICKLHDIGGFDITLVFQYLKDNDKLDEIGGAYYLSKIMNCVVSTSNFNKYCSIVKEKSARRKSINFASIILAKATDESEEILDVIMEAEYCLNNINAEIDDLENVPNSDVILEILQKFYTKIHNDKNNVVNENEVFTGLSDWDEINGGLFNGLYVIAGRPAMGKGVHMTELICSMAKTYDIGVISGEMSKEQLYRRIASNIGGFDNYIYKKNGNYVTEDERKILVDSMNEALNLKLHIYEDTDIEKIRNKIKMWVQRHNVKCVIADFLTLFNVPEDKERYFTDVQRINYCLRIFTKLCKELNIPIILYAQMNREILGKGANKDVREPNLSDLKGSGSIEELAFQVSFLHRPEYYNPDNIQDEFGNNTKDVCYQIIAKHRDGKTGKLKYKAILNKSQLKKWEEEKIINWNNETPF
jgi:replicative DNA helicase